MFTQHSRVVHMAPVQLLVQLHTLGATHDPPFSQGGVQTAIWSYDGITRMMMCMNMICVYITSIHTYMSYIHVCAGASEQGRLGRLWLPHFLKKGRYFLRLMFTKSTDQLECLPKILTN